MDMAHRGLQSAVGRGYRVSDLPVVTQMATAAGFVAVLVLMLYVNEPSVLHRYSAPVLIWGACLVLLYWIARMILIAQRVLPNGKNKCGLPPNEAGHILV